MVAKLRPPSSVFCHLSTLASIALAKAAGLFSLLSADLSDDLSIEVLTKIEASAEEDLSTIAHSAEVDAPLLHLDIIKQ